MKHARLFAITCLTRNSAAFSNTCQLTGYSFAYQFFLITTLDFDFRRNDKTQ